MLNVPARRPTRALKNLSAGPTVVRSWRMFWGIVQSALVWARHPHKQAHLFSRLGRMVGRRDCRVANGQDRSGAPARQVTLSPVDGTALGAAFGSRERINAKAWESVQANCATPFWRRTKASTEVVLTRQCADVSKLMDHMRIKR